MWGGRSSPPCRASTGASLGLGSPPVATASTPRGRSSRRRGGIFRTMGSWSWRSETARPALLRAFPRLPFVWPSIAMGGGGVFVLRAADLDDKEQ